MGISDIKDSIYTSSSIALITHINPDGDAIGSTLGLMYALDTLGKSVDVYCQNKPPITFSFLDGINRFRKTRDSDNTYDLVISLDCGSEDRMGEFASLMDEANVSINIDHHVSNSKFGKFNIIDETASATGEIVYGLVKELIDSSNKKIADALYVAILSDTGGFLFSNTTSKTHRIVADLIEWGADTNELSTQVFKNHSMEWTRLVGLAINSLKTFNNGKVSFIFVTQEMLKTAGAGRDHVTGIIQFAKDIHGVELAVLFFEEDSSKTKVSFRSNSPIDSDSLAEKFGGGGHKRAAGCTVNLPLDKAQREILKETDFIFKGL